MRLAWLALLPILGACSKAPPSAPAYSGGETVYVQMVSVGPPAHIVLRDDTTFEMSGAFAATGSYRVLDTRLELTYITVQGKTAPRGTRPVYLKMDGDVIDMTGPNASGDMFRFKKQ
jgi:hypothetical protein